MRVELRLTFAFRVHAHRAEFQDCKEPAMQAWAALTEQNRRSHAHTNADRYYDHERSRNQQNHTSRDKVCKAFPHRLQDPIRPWLSLTDPLKRFHGASLLLLQYHFLNAIQPWQIAPDGIVKKP